MRSVPRCVYPILATLIFAACQADGDPQRYFSTGEMPVGSQSIQMTGSDGGQFAVQLWYPLRQPGQAMHRYLGFLAGGAFESAEASCPTTRPVVIFSHGNTAIGFQSYSLMEHLASHGYVIAAPNHRGNTFLDQDEDHFAEMAMRRPQDIADTFDGLVNNADGVLGSLAGCIDPTAGYAVIGHSFGAWTTLATVGGTISYSSFAAACEYLTGPGEILCEGIDQIPQQEAMDLSDPRAWAGIAYAPAAYETFGPGLSAVRAPTALFNGSLDTSTPTETQAMPVYNDLTVTPRALIEVEGVGHLAFSNFCELLGGFKECEQNTMSSERLFPIMNGLSLAFLEYVRGDQSARDVLPPQDDSVTWHGEF